MAEILPNKPIGDVSPEVAKLFARLKGLDEEFRIRWSLPRPGEKQRPDFAVFLRDKHVFLLCISRLAAPVAERMLEERRAPLLFSSQSANVDNFATDEERTLTNFLESVGGTSSLAVDGVVPVILFPNVPTALLNQLRSFRLIKSHCIGKESCANRENIGHALRSARGPVAPA